MVLSECRLCDRRISDSGKDQNQKPAEGPGRFKMAGCSLLLPLCLIVFLTGCASYQEKMGAIRGNWENENWEQASSLGESMAKSNANHRDAVLLFLEEGTLFRSSLQFEKSQTAYDRAWDRIRLMDENPEIRISQEAVNLFINPAMQEYEARTYDRIMLHTYSALNFMNFGQWDNVRVALNRAANDQRDAVSQNRRRIEETQERLGEVREQEGSTIDLNKIKEAPETQDKLASIYEETKNRAPYAPYVNPFSVYLDGLFFLSHPEDGSDLERGRFSMRRAHELNPESAWLRSEYELSERVVRGEPQPSSVIIFYETGEAPTRRAVKLELPLFLFGSGSVPFFAVSFPVLDFIPRYPSQLSIEVDGKRFQAETIVSMDRVVAQEFRDHLSVVQTKAILSAALKAATLYVARSAVQDGSTAQALIDIFGIIYQAATNQPDLRSWMTLPKEIQGYRVPMPENGVITFFINGRKQTVEVSSENAHIKVVHIRVTLSGNRPSIHQFTLL